MIFRHFLNPFRLIAIFIKLVRPLNLLQAAIAVLVTASLFPVFPSWDLIMFTAFASMACMAGGNAINDYFDYKTDVINRPDRALPSRKIGRGEALAFSTYMFILGICCFSIVFRPVALIILLINLFLLVTYTPFLKPTILFGNIAVSYLLGSTFLFAADIFGNIKYGIVPAALAFTFNIARELIKDIEDKPGDKANNIRTLPVLIGTPKSIKIAAFFIVLILVGCFIPYSLGLYGIFYLIALIITVEIPLLFVLNLLRISKKKEDFSRISKIMKLLVFFGLLSIYLGKY